MATNLRLGLLWLTCTALVTGCGAPSPKEAGAEALLEPVDRSSAWGPGLIPPNPLLDQPVVPGSYEALLHAYCRGEVEDVLAAIPEQYGDYRLVLLRARSATAVAGRRWRSQLDMPSEQRKREGRQLARERTAAYEAAFRSAPSRFRQARVTAEWMGAWRWTWDLGGDSELLRSGLPSQLPPLDEADQRRMQEAGRRIGDVVRQTFGAMPFKDPAEKAHYQKLGDVFEEQFKVIAPINPPDELVRAVAADVPPFLLAAVPRGALQKPEEAGDTVLWHLWVAFTQPLPHPIERAYIDRQVEEYAVYMESAIDALSEGNDTVPLGDMHAREFRRRYFALRDIRFVPYFKQVYLPGDLAMVAHLNRDLEEFAAGLRSGYSPPAGEGARERNARRHRGDAQMILASLLRAYFRDKPSPLRLRQLPERNVKGFSMRPNESNIWTYSIDQAEPFPPYSPEGAAGDTAP